MAKANFGASTFVHHGVMPPEEFEVLVDGRDFRARRMTASDEAEICAAVTESESLLRAWLSWHDSNADRSSWSNVAKTVAHEFATANWWNERRWFNWLIWDDDLLLGMVDTGPKGDGNFEMGYWRADRPEARGVIGQVVRNVVAIDFNVLGAERIIFNVNAANEPSRRIPLDLGAALDHEESTAPVSDSKRSTTNQTFVLRREVM